MEKLKKTKGLFFILSAFILLTLVGGIVYAAYTGPDPTLRVRTEMVEKCHTEKELDSCYYSATVSNGTTCKLGPQAVPCSQPASWEWLAYCGYDRTGSVQYIPVYKDVEVCSDVPTDVQYGNATVGGSITCTNLNGWCTDAATVNVTSNEPYPGASITAIEGDVNGSGSSAQRTFSSSGTTNLEYWAVSSLGDTSLKGNTTVKVDMTAPSSSASAPSGWVTGANTITNNSSDSQSGIQISTLTVTGDYSSSCSGASCSVTVPSSITGTINWLVYSQDNVNLVSSTNGSFNVDNTLPIVSCTGSVPDGQNGWYISNPVVSVSASDAHSGLASTNYSFSSSEGTGISATCFATDNVGLVNSTTIGNYNIDKSSPVGVISVPNEGATISSTTIFNGTASDSISGIQQVNLVVNGKTVGSSSNSNWSISFNPSSYSNGSITITFQFVDNAGNTTSQTRTITINNPAPKAALAPARMAINGTVERIDRDNGYVIVNGTRYDLTSISKLVGSINIGTTVTGYAMNYHDGTYADVVELYAQMSIINISGVVTNLSETTVTINGTVYEINSSSNIPAGLAVGDSVVGTAQPSWFAKNDSIITLTIIPPTATLIPTPTKSVQPTENINSKKAVPTATNTPLPEYIDIDIDGMIYSVLASDYAAYQAGEIDLNTLLGLDSIDIAEQVTFFNQYPILSVVLALIALLLLFFLLFLIIRKKFEGELSMDTNSSNSVKIIQENETIELTFDNKLTKRIIELNGKQVIGYSLFNKIRKIEKLK